MYVFFDLDGTIIDVSERYYRIYSDLLCAEGMEPLPLDAYWSKKMGKVTETDILKEDGFGSFVERYSAERKRLIEAQNYLRLDKVVDGAHEALEQIASHYVPVIVTLRQEAGRLMEEIGRLDLSKYFSDVLTSAKRTEPRWRIKYELIRRHGFSPCQDIIVGDTETDILAGKKLNIHTVAVLNGIRFKDILEVLEPDYAVESIRELPELLRGLCANTTPTDE